MRILNAEFARRTAAFGCLVFACLLPFYFTPFWVGQLTQVLVIALAVMGLNLLTGFTGQVSVGHSAFFGVGAYTAAIASSQWGTGPMEGLAFAAITGAVVGFVAGLPAQRIKGIHLALVTTILAVVFPAVVRRFETWTGGSQGIRGEQLGRIDGLSLEADQVRFYVVLAVVVIVGSAILMMSKRPLGRSLRAVGDHETAAVVFGARPARLRLLVFTLSAATTSAAGALFVATSGFISPLTSYVTIFGSIVFLTALVLGGRAVIFGPIIGAAIVELVPNQLAQSSPEVAPLIYGVVIIAVLLFLPGGLSAVPSLLLGWIKKGRTILFGKKGRTSSFGKFAKANPQTAEVVVETQGENL